MTSSTTDETFPSITPTKSSEERKNYKSPKESRRSSPTNGKPYHYQKEQRDQRDKREGREERERSNSLEEHSNRGTVPKKYATSERETDPVRLKNRQRQLDFGRNTIGYELYLKQVPRNRRKPGDPQTPEKHQICSKRSWDGQIKVWRKKLHFYDPPKADDEIVIDFEEEMRQQEEEERENSNTANKKSSNSSPQDPEKSTNNQTNNDSNVIDGDDNDNYNHNHNHINSVKVEKESTEYEDEFVITTQEGFINITKVVKKENRRITL